MSNARLAARLEEQGWYVEHGYDYTWVRAPDGRTGKIPHAERAHRHLPWSTYLWDRVKRDLRLQGKEIHG